MDRIKCNVASCKYNEAGETCNAEEIQVNNNYGISDMEFGSFENNYNAVTSMETCCKTFVPKQASTKF